MNIKLFQVNTTHYFNGRPMYQVNGISTYILSFSISQNSLSPFSNKNNAINELTSFTHTSTELYTSWS